MIETQEREINGAMYQSTTFTARRALAVGARLMKFIGPSLGKLGGSIKIEDDKIVEFDSSVLPEALKLLLDNLDSNKVVTLVLDLLASTTRVDPKTNKREEVWKDKVFDLVYAANFGELMGALRFAVEVSLGSFFGEGGISKLLDRASAAVDKLRSPTGSPSE